MAKKHSPFLVLFLGAFSATAVRAAAQNREPNGTVFRVTVDMVQLDVAVTDKKGNYVTRLTPGDFAVFEDGIRQQIATFGEESEPPRRLQDFEPGEVKPKLVDSFDPNLRPGSSPGISRDGPSNWASPFAAGASVFILFDTSNYMYRGFVFAQDAIADFVRSLDHPDRVAFYSYSRDLYRAAALTSDRSEVVRGVRTSVAGDDAALYNSLLLTVQDAGQHPGRKVIVVFSNGPDNSSMVPPEDVAELAQSAGIPIYMISTTEAQLEPVSTAVFDRMSAATGGKAYFAKSWRDEKKAFASIRDDLAHLYSFSYYPKPNPNRGWRSIKVQLVGDRLKKYHVRTRNGYRPRPNRFSADNVPPSTSESAPN